MKTPKPNAVHVLALFQHDTRAATAVEYAVIAGLIGIGVLVGITAIPDALNAFFNNVGNNMAQP
jgi:pilus assembly protein Flp/PilA